LIQNKIENSPNSAHTKLTKKSKQAVSQKEFVSTPKEKSTDDLGFKKNQPVRHKTFGMGLVQEIEKKNANSIVTVNFKSGIKKIMSRFLEIV